MYSLLNKILPGLTPCVSCAPSGDIFWIRGGSARASGAVSSWTVPSTVTLSDSERHGDAKDHEEQEELHFDNSVTSRKENVIFK